MTKVSLITVTRNSAETIEDTLRSAAAQTHDNVERIIIDGASTDNTLEIVRKFSDSNWIIISEPDEGIYDAYNKGITVSSGDVIAFLNSDDYYCSNTVIEEAVDVLKDQELSAVYADMIYVDRTNVLRPRRYWKGKQLNRAHFSQGFHPGHPSLFLKRSVYAEVGMFDKDSFRMAADVEFMFRVFYKHQIQGKYVPKCWVHMRDGGLTGGNARSVKRQNDEILRAHRQYDSFYPWPLFYGRKILDRSLQRLRAKMLALPLGTYSRD